MLLFLHKPAAEEALMDMGSGNIMPPPRQLPKEMGELQAAMRALTAPGAATAGLNWYR